MLHQDVYFDVDPLNTAAAFDINYERGEFICCVHPAKDASGHGTDLPDDIDLQKLMQRMDDTTNTMFADHRYRDYTVSELQEMSR